uniref:Uncharacterized protein n=1 Tax=Odontella aurita TaxID=265563 RepID=A0A7S4NE31_9STRA|mmetsp:Transcript_59219/g.176002  ORF Transcript_59219/g.176002 Transcript_59219/m.176002 type:complete len:135 (+) Transcript_59219:46-450(+)
MELLAVREEEEHNVMRKLSALASIGFAVGSQKLLLNIRHEMANQERDTPRALGLSLLLFGGAYVGVCVLAGLDPPPFLLDAVGAGLRRRVAGLLLWIHVAVSFAINSQALTSSFERVGFHRVRAWGLSERRRAL